MIKKIHNINVNYQQYGKGKDIVLLHGWGQNIEMMEPLGNRFSNNFRITIIDLPGFGLSDEPDKAYSVFDYVSLLHDLFIELDIENPILIGHSFGGRLSIVYASVYKTLKLVLFGSPCVRHEYKSRKQSILKALKKCVILKPLVGVMKKHMGSVDYKKATPIMREVLVKTVNEDLAEYAKKINCPTLLIWGDKDEAVPVSEARELDALINDSALIVLPGTHYCYLENIDQIENILKEFFRGDL